MSGTYIAWNDQPYPWPPPEGWYEGSDGRWWAPGSGPEPDRSLQETEVRQDLTDQAATETPEEAENATGTATEDKPELEEDPQEEPSSEQSTIITRSAQRPLPNHADSVAATVDDDEAGSTPSERASTGRLPGTTIIDDQPKSRRFSNVLVVAAGAATLLLIGAGLVALFNRGDNLSSATSSLTEPVTTTAADQSAIQTLTTQNLISPDPDTAPPPTTQPGQTSTTTSGTTITAITDPPASDSEVIDALNAAAWRDALADRGIDTTALSNEDIIDFGKSFCVFAVVSVDAEEFDTYRDKAQTGIAGALTEAQLSAAIDAAVVTFCAEDAERLGIEL